MDWRAKIIAFGIVKAIALVLAFILLCWFLVEIRSLLLFIGVAAVISLIGRPIVLFFRDRLRFGNTLASIITLTLVLSTIVLLFAIFVPIIIEQSKNISEIDFELVKSDLNELSIQASDYLGVEEINLLEAAKRSTYVQDFDVEIIPSFVDIFFNNIGDLIIGIFSVLFIAFFLLKDENLIPKTIAVFISESKERRAFSVLLKTRILLSRYFLGLLIQILILTILYSFILVVFDIKNPFAIALICAFLNIVPYLGPLIGGAIMLLVTLSNNLGADFSSQLVPLLLKVFGAYVLAQLIDNLLIQPIVFGKSVRSHPLEIFLAILIGGLLFNIAGMILAVPTYTALKVLSKEFLSEYKIVKRLTKDL